MTVILIGALLVICGVLYMAGRAIWQGRLSGRKPAAHHGGDHDSRAANAWHRVRSQIELDRARARWRWVPFCCLRAPPWIPGARRAVLMRHETARLQPHNGRTPQLKIRPRTLRVGKRKCLQCCVPLRLAITAFMVFCWVPSGVAGGLGRPGRCCAEPAPAERVMAWIKTYRAKPDRKLASRGGDRSWRQRRFPGTRRRRRIRRLHGGSDRVQSRPCAKSGEENAQGSARGQLGGRAGGRLFGFAGLARRARAECRASRPTGRP